MSANGNKSDRYLEADLIGAALRYSAVADWFEHLPVNHREMDRDHEAMDAFNRVEAELRKAGRGMLRRMGHRELVLRSALKELALGVEP